MTITREHLFSRWVDKILTPDLLGPDRSYERTITGPDGVTITTTWPTEVIATIEAPVVCGSCEDGCNEGWMGSLDGQVRQLLEPMMLGGSQILTPDVQLTIAAWAAMKSMVLEYVWGPDQPPILPQAARTHIFQAGCPPDDMQIRIAAVESRGRPALALRRTYKLRSPARAASTLAAFACCTTFVLGCFVVQTYGSSMTGPARQTQPHGRDYLVINPPPEEAVRWPPSQLLDDAGLDRFAHPLQPITGD